MRHSRSVREPSAQCRPRRIARPSPSVCDHPATPTSARQPSPSISNLGDRSLLTTLRPSLVPAAIISTYRAPITRARGTPSAATECGRRSTRSVLVLVTRELPRLQTSTSFRRSGSASPLTTKVPSGGGSWWFGERTTTGRRDGLRGGTSDPEQCQPHPETGGGAAPGGTSVRPRPTSRVRGSRAANVQQPSGQPGRGYGTSPTGQPITQGRSSHGLPLSRYSPGGRKERDIQVYGVFIEPAFA
jgi:hypothetical protein